MTPTAAGPNTPWTRVAVDCVENLREAVLGAGLEATQLSRGAMEGSLAFATGDQMTFSTGSIGGHVSLRGPLSQTMTTLGVALHFVPGCRHWMNEVETGAVGVFRPGDNHEAIYRPGSIYACVSVRDERLEEIAADMDLVLDSKQLGSTGICRRSMSQGVLTLLRHEFGRLHTSGNAAACNARTVGNFLLASLIRHQARKPRMTQGVQPLGYGQIVASARGFIVENLASPLSLGDIARAACASQSTLYRAFREVLDETPQSFVRKLRLNRIRRDLASEAEALCSITLLASRWGVTELGRFAGWYRELFGELPSQTRARRLSMLHSAVIPAELKKTA